MSWRSSATSSRSWPYRGLGRFRPAAWGIPSIGITGFSGFGDSSEGPYTNNNKVFEIIDNVSWLRGNHSFKVGGSIRFDQFNQVGNQFPRGAFQFNGTATTAGGATPAPANAMADYLLGYQRLSELSTGLARIEFLATSQSYYFTDTWRMRDNMTLDLGLRYEYTPPWLDKGGTLINAYLPFHDVGLPVADLSRHPTLVGRSGTTRTCRWRTSHCSARSTARESRCASCRLV